MASTIDGKTTKPMPASVTAKMAAGVPKATAQAGMRVTSSVKVR